MNEHESHKSDSRTVLWIVLLTLVHCFTWFAHYGQTPLGESPALDNRQTLLLAGQMANAGLSLSLCIDRMPYLTLHSGILDHRLPDQAQSCLRLLLWRCF